MAKIKAIRSNVESKIEDLKTNIENLEISTDYENAIKKISKSFLEIRKDIDTLEEKSDKKELTKQLKELLKSFIDARISTIQEMITNFFANDETISTDELDERFDDIEKAINSTRKYINESFTRTNTKTKQVLINDINEVEQNFVKFKRSLRIGKKILEEQKKGLISLEGPVWAGATAATVLGLTVGMAVAISNIPGAQDFSILDPILNNFGIDAPGIGEIFDKSKSIWENLKDSHVWSQLGVTLANGTLFGVPITAGAIASAKGIIDKLNIKKFNKFISKVRANKSLTKEEEEFLVETVKSAKRAKLGLDENATVSVFTPTESYRTTQKRIDSVMLRNFEKTVNGKDSLDNSLIARLIDETNNNKFIKFNLDRRKLAVVVKSLVKRLAELTPKYNEILKSSDSYEEAYNNADNNSRNIMEETEIIIDFFHRIINQCDTKDPIVAYFAKQVKKYHNSIRLISPNFVYRKPATDKYGNILIENGEIKYDYITGAELSVGRLRGVGDDIASGNIIPAINQVYEYEMAIGNATPALYESLRQVDEFRRIEDAARASLRRTVGHETDARTSSERTAGHEATARTSAHKAEAEARKSASEADKAKTTRTKAEEALTRILAIETDLNAKLDNISSKYDGVVDNINIINNAKTNAETVNKFVADGTLDALLELKTDLEEYVSTLNTKLEELNAREDNNSEAIKKLTQSITARKKYIDSIIRQIKAKQKTHGQAINTAQKGIGSLKRKVADIETKIDEIMADVIALEEDFGAILLNSGATSPEDLGRMIAELKTRINNLGDEDAIKQLKAKLNKAEKKLKGLGTAVSSAQKGVNKNKAKSKELENRIRVIENNLARFEGDFSVAFSGMTLAEIRADYEAFVADYRTFKANSQTSVTTLDLRIKQAYSRITTLENNVRNINRNITTLKNSLKGLKNKVADNYLTIVDEIGTLNFLYESIVVDIESIRDDLTLEANALHSKANNVKTILETIQITINNVNKTLNSTKTSQEKTNELNKIKNVISTKFSGETANMLTAIVDSAMRDLTLEKKVSSLEGFRKRINSLKLANKISTLEELAKEIKETANKDRKEIDQQIKEAKTESKNAIKSVLREIAKLKIEQSKINKEHIDYIVDLYKKLCALVVAQTKLGKEVQDAEFMLVEIEKSYKDIRTELTGVEFDIYDMFEQTRNQIDALAQSNQKTFNPSFPISDEEKDARKHCEELIIGITCCIEKGIKIDLQNNSVRTMIKNTYAQIANAGGKSGSRSKLDLSPNGKKFIPTVKNLFEEAFAGTNSYSYAMRLVNTDYKQMTLDELNDYIELLTTSIEIHNQNIATSGGNGTTV